MVQTSKAFGLVNSAIKDFLTIQVLILYHIFQMIKYVLNILVLPYSSSKSTAKTLSWTLCIYRNYKAYEVLLLYHFTKQKESQKSKFLPYQESNYGLWQCSPWFCQLDHPSVLIERGITFLSFLPNIINLRSQVFSYKAHN